MRLAFFGDSLTEGNSGAAYFPLVQRRFLQHELFNYGLGGDTVLSLYRRVVRIPASETWDLAFLWVGVNDVLVKTSWTYPLIKRLRRQPWARDQAQFVRVYSDLLSHLGDRAGHVVAVSPLFLGEDLSDDWNRRLGDLALGITETARNFPRASFLDLRAVFRALIEEKRALIEEKEEEAAAPYLPRSAGRVLRDILIPGRGGADEHGSQEHGLRFTMDGIHLNEVGAEIVADSFSREIADWEAAIRPA